MEHSQSKNNVSLFCFKNCTVQTLSHQWLFRRNIELGNIAPRGPIDNRCYFKFSETCENDQKALEIFKKKKKKNPIWSSEEEERLREGLVSIHEGDLVIDTKDKFSILRLVFLFLFLFIRFYFLSHTVMFGMRTPYECKRFVKQIIDSV